MLSKNKLVNIQCKLYYLFTDFFNAVLLIYLPLYLKNRFDYSGSQIGTILFVAGIFAIIGILIGPKLANLFHLEKSVILSEMIAGLLALFIIYFTNDFNLICLCTGITYLIKMSMYSIGDNFIADLCYENNLTFSKQRSFGSIGWGLSFLINSYLVVHAPQLFIKLYGIMLIGAIINISLIKEKPKTDKIVSFIDKQTIMILFSNKKTLYYVILASFVYVVTQIQPNFMNFYILDLNGSVELLGLLTAVFVIVEFLVMYFASNLQKRFNSQAYFDMIILLLLLKLLIVCFASSPIIIYVTLIIDPIVFGLLLPFNTLYLKACVPLKYNNSLLSIFGVLSLILISIFSKIAGNLMSVFNTQAVFIMLFIIVLSMYISLRFIKIDNKELNKKE